MSTANRQADRGIANIVILTNLDLANEHIQIQVLEVCAMWLFSFFLLAGSDAVRLKLLRTKRIFTRTAFCSAPKTFLIVAVKSSSGLPLVKHLVRYFQSCRRD